MNNKTVTFFKVLIAGFLFVALAACDPASFSEQAPEQELRISNQKTVVLSGNEVQISAQYFSGGQLVGGWPIYWQQESGPSVQETVASNNSSYRFIAPDVTTDTDIVLTASTNTDTNGSLSESITLTVKSTGLQFCDAHNVNTSPISTSNQSPHTQKQVTDRKSVV